MGGGVSLLLEPRVQESGYQGEPGVPHKTPLHGFCGGVVPRYRHKMPSFLDGQTSFSSLLGGVVADTERLTLLCVLT